MKYFKGTASQSALSAWADVYYKKKTEYLDEIMPLKVETARQKMEYWKKMNETDPRKAPDEIMASDSEDEP